MFVDWLRIAGPQKTTFALMLSLAIGLAQVAHAQAPLVQGPETSRPELLPEEADDVELPMGGRTLPRIEIPIDDPGASALSGNTIAVREFRFSGNLAFTDAELDGITEQYKGNYKRYSALLEARDRVTRAYIDAGYVSSGAVLPRQDFSGGIVKITIVEGGMGEIQVETNGRLRERYFTSRLEAGGGTLNVNELRERLRRLKRDPRIESVAAELIPGEGRGESVLSIVVDEAEPYWVTAAFDNYAPESIGGLRGRFRGGHRNMAGWGDSFSAAYTVSEELHDIDVRFEAPVSRWDTTVEVWMRRAWSKIIESEFEKLIDDNETFGDIKSRTQAYGIRIHHPVMRRRGQEARLFLAADWKRGRSFLTVNSGRDVVIGDPDNKTSTVTVLRMGGDYLLRRHNRALAARLTGSFGINALSATTVAGSRKEEFADGKFLSGLLQVQEVEYLPWNDMRLQTRLDAQVADDILLGLERFAAGGNGTVRGYRENLVVRDQGVVASVELRVPIPIIKPIDRLEIGIFTDVGYAADRKTDLRPKSATTVASVGLGVHANITDYVRISIQWAKDLKDPGDSVSDGNELQDKGLHFALQARFP